MTEWTQGHPAIDEKWSIQNPRVNDIFAECPAKRNDTLISVQITVTSNDGQRDTQQSKNLANKILE
jgi:hypothetical protein